MKKKEFIRKVIQEFPDRLPEGFREEITVTANTVTKVNDSRCHGIVIRKEGEQGSPTFYLDDMYEEYTNGASFDFLLNRLVNAYLETTTGPRVRPTLPPLNEDGTVTLLALRLLSYDRNIEYLRDVPYRDVGNGLVLTCDVRAGDGSSGEWRMRITNDLLEEMHLDRDQLFEDALYSCSLGNPAVLIDLEDKVTGKSNQENILYEYEEIPEEKRSAMYLLSTKRYHHGASALFYKGVMEEIARLIDGNYYIIPTSVHELLIIPDAAGIHPEYLKKMLTYGNHTVVGPDEILSDDIYHYDRKTGLLSTYVDIRYAC